MTVVVLAACASPVVQTEKGPGDGAPIRPLAPVSAQTVSAQTSVPVLTDDQLAALPPQALSLRLEPLRRAATSIGGLGRTSEWSRVWTDVQLDANHGVVRLLVTSRIGGLRLLAAARLRADFDASIVQIVVVPHCRLVLDAVVSALAVDAPRGRQGAIFVATDGSGVVVEVTGPPTSPRWVQQSLVPGEGPVKVSFVRAIRRSPKEFTGAGATAPRLPQAYSPSSWAASKWHDHQPFIGGDLVTVYGTGTCSLGIPAVRISNGQNVMLAAAHCFSVGSRAYTSAGPTWAFGNHQVGDLIGTVTTRITRWDTAVIVGASNNADESDTAGWYPLSGGVAYSYTGDYVCQTGARSAWAGHSTPCGIKVTNDDIVWPIAGYYARGVEGIDIHGWGSINGDSGALVFAQTATGRQARGMVSDGGADGTVDQRRVDWSEAPDSLAAAGLKLNPVT